MLNVIFKKSPKTIFFSDMILTYRVETAIRTAHQRLFLKVQNQQRFLFRPRNILFCQNIRILSLDPVPLHVPRGKGVVWGRNRYVVISADVGWEGAGAVSLHPGQGRQSRVYCTAPTIRSTGWNYLHHWNGTGQGCGSGQAVFSSLNIWNVGTN